MLKNHWTVYGKILQFHPVRGYLAVVYDEETNRLWSYPIDALGLVEVSTHSCTRRCKDGIPLDRKVQDQEPEIVGMVLDDGYWNIVNDAGNFAGLCRDGDDITKAIGCLDCEYRDRLEKQSPNGE